MSKNSSSVFIFLMLICRLKGILFAFAMQAIAPTAYVIQLGCVRLYTATWSARPRIRPLRIYQHSNRLGTFRNVFSTSNFFQNTSWMHVRYSNVALYLNVLIVACFDVFAQAYWVQSVVLKCLYSRIHVWRSLVFNRDHFWQESVVPLTYLYPVQRAPAPSMLLVARGEIAARKRRIFCRCHVWVRISIFVDKFLQS